jgi:ankyrin repeat protein
MSSDTISSNPAVAAVLLILVPFALIPIGYFIYGPHCDSKHSNLSPDQLSDLVSQLLYATYRGDLITVNSLLQFKPDLVNMKGTLPVLVLNFQRKRTALNIAVCSGYFGLVTYLLDYGADVNEKDDNGLTPLMWAAMRNDKNTALLLLQRGADPRIKSDQGADVLSIAVMQKKVSFTRVMQKVFLEFTLVNKFAYPCS